MGQLPSGNVAFGPSAAACAVPTCLPSPLQVYSPWNLHEPYPGEYVWTGFADIERWMALIQARLLAWGMWVVGGCGAVAIVPSPGLLLRSGSL